MLALGTFSYGRVLPGFENYGFDGLAVSLLGGNTAIGILLGGLLIGGLKSGQSLMQTMRVPLEIAQIVSALLILFVAMQHGIDRFLNRLGGAKQIKSVEPAREDAIKENLETEPTPEELAKARILKEIVSEGNTAEMVEEEEDGSN